MKTNKSYHAFSIFVLIASSCFTIGWAESWDQIKNAAGLVHTVRCDFIQEKHMKILANPLVSKGVFYFKVPGSLRWEYESPIKSILLMHKGKTKRFVMKDDRFIEDSSANLQAMGFVLKEITMWLNGRFDENPQFTASLKAGYKIVLLPKEKSFSMMIQKIELIFSDRPGIIKAVTIYESDNSFTRLVFNNARLNEKIDDSMFRKI
jgi:outer membrane lipoprotein-sorting protein